MARTENYLSPLQKQELADYLIFQLLYKDTTLTYKQVRKALRNAYKRIAERGGVVIYDQHKRTVEIAKQCE